MFSSMIENVRDEHPLAVNQAYYRCRASIFILCFKCFKQHKIKHPDMAQRTSMVHRAMS